MSNVKLWPDSVPRNHNPICMVTASDQGERYDAVFKSVCNQLIERLDEVDGTAVFNFCFAMTESTNGYYTIIATGTAAEPIH